MSYFFDDYEKVEALRKTLKEWLGTPFRHHAGVKGLGTDCLHMVKGVTEELGIRSPKIPKYPKDWHQHQHKDMMIEGLDSAKTLELQPDINPRNGDVVVFKFGNVNSHVAIYCDGMLYHAVFASGVICSSYKDAYFQSRIRRVYRVKA